MQRRCLPADLAGRLIADGWRKAPGRSMFDKAGAAKERMGIDGLETTRSTPERARTRLETEMPEWAKPVRQSGVTAE